MRIIDDDTYAKLIKILAQDEKVAVFQKLLLSEKAELTEPKEQIKENREVKK